MQRYILCTAEGRPAVSAEALVVVAHAHLTEALVRDVVSHAGAEQVLLALPKGRITIIIIIIIILMIITTLNRNNH